VPENLGPGRRIVSRTTRQGVSRFGGQAGTQAPRPYARTTAKPRRPGRKHYPHPPCRIGVPHEASTCGTQPAQIGRLCVHLQAVFAAAAVRVMNLFDPNGPDPYRSWGMPFFQGPCRRICGQSASRGSEWSSSLDQRRSRRQLPPRSGPDGRALEAEWRGGAGRGPVPGSAPTRPAPTCGLTTRAPQA
jgi:hypothetical protein